MRLKFKMLTLKQVMSLIRSEDWFVTIDLKDSYFHVSILPTHMKFLRFAFGGKAYQYRVLPFSLALSPRTFTKCTQLYRWLVDFSSIRADGSYENAGAKTERQEKCAFSGSENHLSGCGVEFDHDAFTFTFMHLADAFIQSDLQCIQVIHFIVSTCVPWDSNPQPLRF